MVDRPNGNALQFNGSYVTSGASLVDARNGSTVAAWVRMDDPERLPDSLSQDGDVNSGYFLHYSGSANRFAFSFVGVRAPAPGAANPGQWYHLVGACATLGAR